MQMQDLSFIPQNEVFTINKYRATVEIFSFDNLFTIAPNTLINRHNILKSHTILWGDDQLVEGAKVSIKLNEDKQDNSQIKIDALLDQPIRCLKLSFLDLPLGKLVSLPSGPVEITNYGSLYHYPEGWRSITTPQLVFALADGRYLYVRSHDSKVREKRFFLKSNNDGTMRVELIFEDLATDIKNSIDVPLWEVGFSSSIESIYREMEAMNCQNYHLVPFDKRSDVPSWFHDISLVVTCHMEHWTGKIFHTYQQALEDLKILCQYIDGKHILFYIPGWEGRYYFKYGNYVADDRLGGSKGLKDLVEGAHKMGVKVMAMYGINMANHNLDDFSLWGPQSEFVLASGGMMRNGSVDWDSARHYDHNINSQLNPGAPKWQNKLFNEIDNATKMYGFDAAFLDIAACWVNDRRYDVVPGVHELCRRLKNGRPDFLISGEGWYDGLTMAMPLFQSGHTEGRLHYHDQPDENIFTNYAREFAHLCLGDAARGSTGVHELGINDEVMVPLRKGIIPTMALVDGTIKNGLPKVIEIIDQAKKYEELYLND
ncbi:MAG: hypothetical protein LKF69_03580 [Bacilli bacterium]|jgi:hypothetical protein|nr:hypothetical protein [Bacilli bacterium]MCH4235862.1 hypothetical protein [Bacilli bacterium]